MMQNKEEKNRDRKRIIKTVFFKDAMNVYVEKTTGSEKRIKNPIRTKNEFSKLSNTKSKYKSKLYIHKHSSNYIYTVCKQLEMETVPFKNYEMVIFAQLHEYTKSQ